MARAPTMKDVARAAGVSVMTVSRAFKADSSINADTRARIRTLAEDMGYVFDSMAANLRAQRSDFSAAIIPSLKMRNCRYGGRAVAAVGHSVAAGAFGLCRL